MKTDGKLITVFALALVLVLGGMVRPVTTAARGSELVSDGSGGWKYEIPSGENRTLDLTTDDKVTSGFQFHLKTLGAGGSIHIQAGQGYVLRAQGNVNMNYGNGKIYFYNGADAGSSPFQLCNNQVGWPGTA